MLTTLNLIHKTKQLTKALILLAIPLLFCGMTGCGKSFGVPGALTASSFRVSDHGHDHDGSGEHGPGESDAVGHSVHQLTSGAMPDDVGELGRVQHADAKTFDDLVLQSEVPVLVDFYGDWCAPCKKLAPTLDELARESRDARIVKVNIDKSPKLAATYRVRAVPTLLVFREGKLESRTTGNVPKEQLKKMLYDEN
jgi:thioredoxin 1